MFYVYFRQVRHAGFILKDLDEQFLCIVMVVAPLRSYFD